MLYGEMQISILKSNQQRKSSILGCLTWKCNCTEFPVLYLLCLLPSLPKKEVSQKPEMLSVLRHSGHEAALAGREDGAALGPQRSRTVRHLLL